jgi:hypothetical protein
LVCHVEVNFSGFPFGAGFGEEGREEREDGQALGKVGFHPGRQFASGGRVGGDDFLEAQVGGWAVRGVEDAADGLGDRGALVEFGHVGLGILLEIKLSALPRRSEKDGRAGGSQPVMVVADNELDAAEAAGLEDLEDPLGAVCYRHLPRRAAFNCVPNLESCKQFQYLQLQSPWTETIDRLAPKRFVLMPR